MTFTYKYTYLRNDFRNRILPLIAFLLLFILPGSCKKENFNDPPAIVQVFNAMDDNLFLYVNMANTRPAIFKTQQEILNKSFASDRNLLFINELPAHVEFYPKSDTMPHDRPIINTALDLKKGNIYSLFLFGEKLSPEQLLIQEKLPGINLNDSTLTIRFANLSAAQTISVNIQGQETGSLFQSIPYKSLSEFTVLPINRATADYLFEVRNQHTGSVLASLTIKGINATANELSNWVFRSNTLVFSGKPGAAFPNDQKLSIMKHR